MRLFNGICLILFCLINPAQAGDANQFSINLHMVQERPADLRIDGELNEAVWQQASSAQLRFENRPRENQPAAVSTEAKLFSDGHTLFIAFLASSASHLTPQAHLNQRDDIWRDDVVGVKIDSLNNNALAYQFFVNPLGVQFDGIENQILRQESGDWDAIWQSRGKLTEQGYQVELAIPLSLFSFDESQTTQQWGIELVRFYQDGGEVRLSTNSIDRNSSCMLCQMGVMNGLIVAQKQSLPWQITPSLVVNQQQDKVANTQNNGVEVGANIRIPVSASQLLNITVNPDFSQVEADSGQLTVNQNSALFLTEKRSFFLENNDYFSTPLDLLYTRNLISPDWGAKYSGSQDKHTLAAFMVQDQFSSVILPGSLGSSSIVLEEQSDNIFARYRFDANTKSRVGAALSKKSSHRFDSQLWSLDGQYRPNQHVELVLQYAQSQSEYQQQLFAPLHQGARIPDETVAVSGSALYGKARYQSRDWYAHATHTRITPNFRADLGFMTQVDYQKSILGLERMWYPQNHFYDRVALYGDWDITHSMSGELLEKELEAQLEGSGKYGSYMNIAAYARHKRAAKAGTISPIWSETERFDQYGVSQFVRFKPLSSLTLELRSSYGDDIDYRALRAAKNLTLNPELIFTLGRGVTVKMDHTYQHLAVAQGKLFHAHLSNARLQWYFDVNQFVRLSSTFSKVVRNQASYQEVITPVSTELSAELLYGYQLNPLSVFYLGANSGLSDRVLENSEQWYARSLWERERKLFMKLSYAIDW